MYVCAGTYPELKAITRGGGGLYIYIHTLVWL